MNKCKRFIFILFLGLVLFGFMGFIVAGDNSESDKKIVTLYQDGPSLVIDRLDLSLDRGVNRVSFPVSDSIIARTVFTTAPDAKFRSSKVIPAVTSEGKLLEQLVGKNVKVTVSSRSDTTFEGILVGVFGGKPLVKTSDGDMTLIRNPGEYRFEEFSLGDKDKILELELVANEDARTELTLGYQLSDLSWSPQYVGFLDEKEESLDLQGIAYIRNDTKWDFSGVQLRLVAGEPKREESRTSYFTMARGLNQQEASSPEQVFEYYRYKVGFPADLTSGEEAQVKFLQKDSVNYRKYYLFEPYSSSAIKTIIELNNSEDEGLGVPIASGTIRMYEGTDEKTFIGEDSLPNLPVNREAELELGSAFDLKGERKRVSHQKVGERIWKDEIEMTIKNSKEEPVQLLIKEKLTGDWEILRSSQDYERVDSETINYEVRVPAKGKRDISYRVQYEI